MKQLLIFAILVICLVACHPYATTPLNNNTIDTNGQYVIQNYINNGVDLKTKFVLSIIDLISEFLSPKLELR
mgnify:CR=1 FL=1